MFEAMKNLVKGYMDYESQEATEENLENIFTDLCGIENLIEPITYPREFSWLMAAKEAFLKIIDEFQSLPEMSINEKTEFQKECARLTDTLAKLAEKSIDSAVFSYSYFLLEMRSTFAPINAFANRCLGMEVKDIFEKVFLSSEKLLVYAKSYPHKCGNNSEDKKIEKINILLAEALKKNPNPSSLQTQILYVSTKPANMMSEWGIFKVPTDVFRPNLESEKLHVKTKKPVPFKIAYSLSLFKKRGREKGHSHRETQNPALLKRMNTVF